MELPSDRYEGLHIPFLLIGNDRDKFVDSVMLGNINIMRRIGSDSMFGTAWLSVMETEDFQPVFVIKFQKNLSKVPYKSIDCDNIYITEKGKRTHIRTGNFIFMEVAQGDLEQILKFHYITNQDLLAYILQIIDSVEIMASQGIYRGDLHVRQIFIVHRNCKPRAVIGDFGESTEFVSATTHLPDIGYFLNSLNETLDNVRRKYSSFDIKLDMAIKYVDKLKKINNKLSEDMEMDEIQEIIARDLEGLREIFH